MIETAGVPSHGLAGAAFGLAVFATLAALARVVV
jgi:hypothetical protein